MSNRGYINQVAMVSLPRRFRLAVGILAVAVCGLLWLPRAVCADEGPEQFRVWGKQAKADPYMGDPGLSEAGTAQVTAAAAETARGFVVFSRPLLDVVGPETLPKDADRCTGLEAQDCHGQYGAVSFCVFALDGGEFSVRVADLHGPGSSTIAAQNFDVRALRYARVADKKGAQTIPLTIEAFTTKTIAARRMQQFWITYYVPAKVPAGVYSGDISILVGGAVKLTLPLKLTVYPFDLKEPEAMLYFYDEETTTPAATYKHLADQRCHGMNMGILPAPMDGRANDLNREKFIPLLDAYQKVGFAKHVVFIEVCNRIIAEWINTPDKSIGMWGPWFRYYPFTDQLDNKYVATISYIRDECKKRGLQLIIETADEAGSHNWTVKGAQHYDALLKRRLPDVLREQTCGGGWASNEPEEQYWHGLLDIWSTNRWLPDKLALVRQGDPTAKLHIYNMGGAGSGIGGTGSARAMFGFFAWKAHVDGAAQWVYFCNDQPDLIYVRPPEDPADGMVPTLHWEAVREGAKDRRFLATLDQLLLTKKGKTAEEARAFLRDIDQKIELRNTEYDIMNGGRVPSTPENYDPWRMKIAQFIERLTAE